MLLKVDKSLRYNLTPERLNIGRPNQLCVHVYLSQPKRKGMKKKPLPKKPQQMYEKILGARDFHSLQVCIMAFLVEQTTMRNSLFKKGAVISHPSANDGSV